MTNDLHNLEHIRTRPLSLDEQSRVWGGIEQRLDTTPAQSPFVFPMHKALSFAFAFVVIVGVVGVSDSAHPGDILFPLDTTVERVESSLRPASRASHAQERLAEFTTLTQTTNAPIAMKSGQADMIRSTGEAAPEMADTLMFSSMVADDTAPVPTPLPEHIEQAVESTRAELEALLSEALMRGNEQTINEILMTIELFEAHVASLRASH